MSGEGDEAFPVKGDGGGDDGGNTSGVMGKGAIVYGGDADDADASFGGGGGGVTTIGREVVFMSVFSFWSSTAWTFIRSPRRQNLRLALMK